MNTINKINKNNNLNIHKILFKLLYPPFVVTVALLFVITISLLQIALQHNNGQLTYTVDDAFIHLAISKNFSQYGVWGVTPYNFSSSSSSLLWDLTISLLFKLFGVAIVVPLVLNFFLATAILALIAYFLANLQFTSWKVASILVFCVLATPLPSLILSGMEHLLQAVLTLLMLLYSSKAFSSNKCKLSVWCLLSFFLAFSRYEGLFTVLIVCTLCLFVWGWRGLYRAIPLGLAALLPVIVYGLISTTKGWYFLPNSVLFKGAVFDLSTPTGWEALLGLRGLLQIFHYPFLLVLFVGLGYILITNRNKTPLIYMTGISFCLIFLHAQFAQIGSFYRYESYLIIAGAPCLILLIPEALHGRRQLNAFALAVFTMMVFATRSVEVIFQTPTAMTNNYEQQFQMGQFLNRYYTNQVIVLNDIGMASFFGRFHLIDAANLGSLEIANALISNGRKPLDSLTLDNLARKNHADIAIVFEAWVPVPSTWERVGRWTISNNVIAAQDTVSFFVLDPSKAAQLRQNLQEFPLPSTVQVKIDPF